MTVDLDAERSATTVQDVYPTRLADGPVLTARQDPVVYGFPPDGPLSAAELGGYRGEGFVTHDALFEPDEVERFRVELDRLASDAALRGDERVVVEPGSAAVRSVFEVHRVSPVFAELVADPRLVDRARQILGSPVYVHQSRLNYKPGFAGRDFYWHSDFETWHAEDGMPRMRALSMSIALTENFTHNGSLMIIPGSHSTFVGCQGETPSAHYRSSLRQQEIGTPDDASLARLAAERGIRLFTGGPGSVTVFDCNCMHGSSSNITPFPRANVFVVYNSVDNACVEPFAARERRPTFIAARDQTPVEARPPAR